METNNLSKNNSNQNIGESRNIKVGGLKTVPKYLIKIFKYLKFLVFLTIILVFVLGYFLLVKSKVETINLKKELLVEKKEELIEVYNYKNKSQELETKYDEFKKNKEEDIKKISKVLPSKSDLPGIIAQVEALVNANGLVLGNISMSVIESKEKTGVVIKGKKNDDTKKVVNDSLAIKNVEVGIFVFGNDGGYNKVKSFLDALENHIRLIDISSLTFDENMNSYSIVFKTYYLEDEK